VRLLCAFLLLGSVALYAGNQSALLDANTATNEQLAALPHLGNREIETIIEGRPYATIGQLNAALSASLDQNQLNELYARLFLPINLNTAPEADILLIPGVGKRMAHEFEEYRPYRSMEQFRREIGKYVDEDEVARLETYVTLD
jgi:DNA uptake protein ComE-like DNA-binding protein